MTFERVLKLLKEDKKVRRTDWGNKNCYISFNLAGVLIKYFWLDRNDYWDWDYYSLDKNDTEADWEEYKEPLLTKEEKEFLTTIIKMLPYRLDELVLKHDYSVNANYLTIIGYAGDHPFGLFYVNDDYFKNLEINRTYSTKELELELED